MGNLPSATSAPLNGGGGEVFRKNSLNTSPSPRWIGPNFLIPLWFHAKRKRFGILLAKGHDGRVEIFRINPGGFSIWMLI